MNNIVIKTHDFEVAKQELREFSKQTATDFDLRKVDSNKGVGEWFVDALFGGGIGLNHKVTGSELNSLTSDIQKHLININTLHNKFIKEFGEVYNALEALDNDYIQAILISIKATEETSKRIEATQGQIKKIVEDQKKTLEILKNFKEKLDNLKHLQDIDKIWNDYQSFHNEILKVNISVEDVVKSMERQAQTFKSFEKFKNQIEQYKNLKNIDAMWEEFQEFRKRTDLYADKIATISKTIATYTDAIDSLLLFKKKIDAYKNLEHIDDLWADTQVLKDEIALINTSIETQKEIFRSEIKAQNDSIDNLLAEDKKYYEEQNKMLFEKLKIAYMLAGSSLGITLITFVLVALGII